MPTPWFETKSIDFTKVYLCPKAEHCSNNHVGGPQHNACHHAVVHKYMYGECCGDSDDCPGCEVVGDKKEHGVFGYEAAKKIWGEEAVDNIDSEG